MIYVNELTKISDLETDDSLTTYKEKWDAQQNHKSFETFFYFLKEVKPNRILEIGTSKGGFTFFLQESCKKLKLDCKILSLDVVEYPWYSDIIESGVEIKIENVFDEAYTDVKDYIKEFISSEGTTIVLCDGGFKQGEFNVLSKYIKEGDFILAHDYSYDYEFFEKNINKKIWNWCEITESDIIVPSLDNNLVDYRRELFQDIAWICKIKLDKSQIIEKPIEVSMLKTNRMTLVTGLWDLGRGNLTEGWSRSFDHYLEKFKQLLQVNENMIIFGDEELEKFVNQHRSSKNTQFVYRPLDWFRENDYYQLIQEIRTKESWYSQTGWLVDSTQAKLEMYNPLVMSKMFLLNDAKIMDGFDSEYMFWIDAGLTNTIHPGYFTHDKVLDKLPKYVDRFSFVCFPYAAETEIHGFDYKRLNVLAGSKVNKVARAGFFGGPKESISDINSIYYGLLTSTLQEGYMGTEESIFTIMTYKHSDLINYFEIEGNGLMGKFFEDLKNDDLKIKTENKSLIQNNLDINKVGLYVITFNSPKQFETLLKSMESYDNDFLTKTRKFLLNNSSDESTTPEYEKLCEEYGFEHIKKDNLGICGGRQWIAEHFDKTDLDYYIFSEDDMFFQNKPNETCKNGFNRYEPNLYTKTLQIMKKESYDFMKFNFTEFYGDNSVQWSWYNVPQAVREEYWPEKTQLPVHGLDPNAPKTKFNNIKSHNGLPYTDGEIYYCNWTQLISRIGNEKMFLNTTWAHPFENTWMSYMYQETKKGNLKGSLLLLTPVEHDRFDHYESGLRKES